MNPLRPIGEGDGRRPFPSLPPLPSEAMPPRPLLAPLQKQCSSCRRLWLYDHFGRDHRASDGLRSQCRHCERAYERARQRRRAS